MTPEEKLDEARAKEALREADEANRYFTFLEVATLAARLAREGWTPPEPVVDPDLLAFREWLSGFYPASKANILQGCRDLTADAEAYLAGQAASAERIKALEGALTPSAGTKYAYLGEFRQARGSRKVTIEWTTIKEIMQAIRDHADALLKEADQ